MKSKRQKVLSLFAPNELGESRWVTVEEIVASDIKWSKNGEGRHGVYLGIKEVNWLKRVPTGNRITALKMNGYKTDPVWDQTITSETKAHFESETICNISLLQIPDGQRNIDHRYGNKKHPDYVRLYSPRNQKPRDFQLVFAVLNGVKREYCKKCCETGVRPKHPTKDFVTGDQSHAENFPCSGCYLAEPEKYR